MEHTSLPSCGTLQELIEEIHRVFQDDCINIEYIHEIMASYKSNPEEWKKYSKHEKFRYTRNLVDEGNGKFNLMILCWPEQIASTIHDHSDSHCFMKLLDGQLEEVRFCWPEPTEDQSQMKETGRTLLDTNDVCYINDTLGLHRVQNPSHTDKAVSLHLYVPPFDTCQTFDDRTGRRRRCNVTFCSKFGEKIRRFKSGKMMNRQESTGDNLVCD